MSFPKIRVTCDDLTVDLEGLQMLRDFAGLSNDGLLTKLDTGVIIVKNVEVVRISKIRALLGRVLRYVDANPPEETLTRNHSTVFTWAHCIHTHR